MAAFGGGAKSGWKTAVNTSSSCCFRDRLSYPRRRAKRSGSDAGVDVSDTQSSIACAARCAPGRALLACSLEDVDPSQCAALDEDPASGRRRRSRLPWRRALFQAMERLPATERRLPTAPLRERVDRSRGSHVTWASTRKPPTATWPASITCMRVAIEATLLKAESRTADGEAMRTSAAS